MPKVTVQQIEALIVAEHYFKARDGYEGALTKGTYHGRTRPAADDADLKPLDKITICVLILKGGFVVTGVNNGPVIDPCDDAIGAEYARKAAIEQIWPLLGYQLHLQQGGDWAFRLDNETDELEDRLGRLKAGIHKAPPKAQDDLHKQQGLMEKLLDILKIRRGDQSKG